MSKTQILERVTEKDLAPVRENMFAILNSFPNEVTYVMQMLVEGRIDGRFYDPYREYSCLFGSIARKQGGKFKTALVMALKFIDGKSIHGNAERVFLHIKAGDTPATNKYSAIAYLLIEEWLTEHEA